MKPFPGGKLTRDHTRNGAPYVLTEEQEAWLAEYFPKIENLRLADAMGISETQMHRFARKQGLKKSKSGLHAIMRRASKHANKTKDENGYHDSLRGKKPEPKVMEAYMAYFYSDRYIHPLHILKKKNPRKYKKLMKEWGEKRRETIKKERLRLFYGLKRKTKLRVSYQSYMPSQITCRSEALRRGYLLSEDKSDEGGERYKIFWDEETERSEKFEKRCNKHGFKLEHA